MGVFLVFLVFGLPLLFIFWASSSQITDGSWFFGFFLMIGIVILACLIFGVLFKDDKNERSVSKITENKNDDFGEKIKNTYGRYFLAEGGEKGLLFEASKYNEFSGYVTLYYISSGQIRTIDFIDIENCVLYKATKIIKKCSVDYVSMVEPKSFSLKYALEIQADNELIIIQSDDLQTLIQIYETTEYIITKGRSMETSPFSI